MLLRKLLSIKGTADKPRFQFARKKMCCVSAASVAVCETVSHLGRGSLSDLPSPHLLWDSAVLLVAVGGSQPSVVCGQHQSTALHSHLWKSQRQKEALQCNFIYLFIFLISQVTVVCVCVFVYLLTYREMCCESITMNLTS